MKHKHHSKLTSQLPQKKFILYCHSSILNPITIAPFQVGHLIINLILNLMAKLRILKISTFYIRFVITKCIQKRSLVLFQLGVLCEKYSHFFTTTILPTTKTPPPQPSIDMIQLFTIVPYLRYITSFYFQITTLSKYQFCYGHNCQMTNDNL